MTIQYTPRGVCSRSFTIQVEDGLIQSVQVVGGCSGNLQGISMLLKGMPVEEAIREVGATVEGYFAALSAHQLSEKMGVEMPICESAYGVLYEGRPVELVVEQLMTRSKRREVDESWI